MGQDHSTERSPGPWPEATSCTCGCAFSRHSTAPPYPCRGGFGRPPHVCPCGAFLEKAGAARPFTVKPPARAERAALRPGVELPPPRVTPRVAAKTPPPPVEAQPREVIVWYAEADYQAICRRAKVDCVADLGEWIAMEASVWPLDAPTDRHDRNPGFGKQATRHVPVRLPRETANRLTAALPRGMTLGSWVKAVTLCVAFPATGPARTTLPATRTCEGVASLPHAESRRQTCTATLEHTNQKRCPACAKEHARVRALEHYHANKVPPARPAEEPPPPSPVPPARVTALPALVAQLDEMIGRVEAEIARKQFELQCLQQAREALAS